ncbi:hypothetical protein MHH33_07235 [Paenisporosarcina sp. FSL H8-0542]|uniref:hypothetical protein n=1 Tax=Paenisporosarcina sp. FSL H8-0542 TaxID=2921401 RepID=UPI00315B35F8
MKKLLNDRGYALLIVLFTIIIFLSMSAVFMSASLNHVKQEQTVDQNNQAVVAAEMGTKFYTTFFNNEIKKIEQNILDTIVNPRLNSLKLCENLVPKGTKCNTPIKITEELNNINNDSLREFNKQMNKLLSGFNNEILIKEITPNTDFVPSRITPETLDVNVKNQAFNFDIIGSNFEANSLKEKKLNTNVKVTIPSYVPNTLVQSPVLDDKENVNTIKPKNLQSCLPLKNLIAPYECDLGNNTISDLNLTLINNKPLIVWVNNLNQAICPSNICQSDLKGLTIKSDIHQDFTVKNGKSISDANIVFPGNMKFESGGNHLNIDLIVESISVSNVLQHVSENIVVLGNKDGTGYLMVEGKKKDVNVSMASGYKLCLNLDGLDDDATNIKLPGSHKGELIYYSSKGESIDGGIKHVGTYFEFLKGCSQKIAPIKDPILTPDVNDSNFDFTLKVDYIN